MTKIRNDDYCIICGSQNPIGLKLPINRDPKGKAWVSLSLPREFEGYRGIAHGGIVATLLDEMMVHALWGMGVPNVTACLKIRYRKPVLVQNLIRVVGEVTGKKGNMYLAKAWIRDAKGVILAEGESILAPVKSG